MFAEPTELLKSILKLREELVQKPGLKLGCDDTPQPTSSLFNVSLRLTPACLEAPPWACIIRGSSAYLCTDCYHLLTVLSFHNWFLWCEAQLSLSMVCNDFCTSFALLDMFQRASGGVSQTRSDHSRTKPQDEGERENWNLLLVKSVFVMCDKLGWTTLRLICKIRWWFQMSHVKAKEEDTPWNNLTVRLMGSLKLYNNIYIHLNSFSPFMHFSWLGWFWMHTLIPVSGQESAFYCVTPFLLCNKFYRRPNVLIVPFLCMCLCPLEDDHQPGCLQIAVGRVPALQGHPHQQGLCGNPDT